MGLSVCPAAIVAAPAEVVWGVLMQPAKYGEWIDGQVDRVVPEGPAAVGQVITITAPAFGRKWQATLKIEKIDAEKYQLGLHANFPFGIQLDEHLSITPIDATSCRVQYG